MIYSFINKFQTNIKLYSYCYKDHYCSRIKVPNHVPCILYVIRIKLNSNNVDYDMDIRLCDIPL